MIARWERSDDMHISFLTPATEVHGMDSVWVHPSDADPDCCDPSAECPYYGDSEDDDEDHSSSNDDEDEDDSDSESDDDDYNGGDGAEDGDVEAEEEFDQDAKGDNDLEDIHGKEADRAPINIAPAVTRRMTRTRPMTLISTLERSRNPATSTSSVCRRRSET
jgi:hypothetical protein